MSNIIEIRSYNLNPGTRTDFHNIVRIKVVPLLRKWKIRVVAFGPSNHDQDSYCLIRHYKDLDHMIQSENDFYNSNDWKGPLRESILSRILNYATMVLPSDVFKQFSDDEFESMVL